jgi:hypothetical protein
MVQNLVLNNSDHTFSVISDQLRAAADQTKVVATPGTDAAVVGQLRADLESGALAASGSGINANYAA